MTTVAVGALGPIAGLAPRPAAAAEPASPPAAAAASGADDQLQEVVVTARFRKENLQQTPIAITALTGSQIEDRGLASMSEIAKTSPNVSFASNTGAYGNSMAAFIRGVGQVDFNPAYEPGVGFYIDDVYYATVYGSDFALNDIDHVEILRGPQGTLFGKNNEGGAVRLFTNTAKGDNSGYVEAGYGSYNHEIFKGAFDVSLVPNKLFLRVFGASNKSDGYVDVLDFACAHPDAGNGTLKAQTTAPDCKTGTEGGSDTRAMHADLRWRASDDLQVDLRAGVTDDNSEVQAQVPLAYNVQSFNPFTGKRYPAAFAASFARATEAKYGLALGQDFIPSDPYATYTSYVSPWDGKVFPDTSPLFSYDFAGTIDWQSPWGVHVKAITGYVNYSGEFGNIASASPLLNGAQDILIDHHQFSEEVQFSGKLFDDALEWTAGAYYFEGVTEQSGLIDQAGVLGQAFLQNDPATVHNTSGFVHGVYHITDKLSTEVGIRYSTEDKTYVFYRDIVGSGYPASRYAVGCFLLVPNPFVTPCEMPGNATLTGRASSSRFDPKVEFNYQFTPDIMGYVGVATGFKGGGINPRPTSLATVVPFKPEDLTAYEIGAKTEWFDRRLRVNVASFVNNYKNLQLTVLVPNTNATLVSNAGHVLGYGFEGEIEAQPLPPMQLNASVSYFRQDTLSTGDAQQSPGNLNGITEGWHQPLVPTWKLNLGAQYSFDLGDYGILTPRTDFTFQTKVFNYVTNTAVGEQGAYGVLDLHLTWDAAQTPWEARLDVTNALDRLYYSSKFTGGLAAFGQVTGNIAPPRMFLFTLKRSF